MRFRPEQHLRRQSDFRAAREQGHRISCGVFTLWGRRREPDAAPPVLPRIGVVASTAAVGHAVLRNRAKRRLRAVFRQHQSLVPAGCDLVINARAAATDCPFAELEKKFADACALLTRKVSP